MSHRRPTVLLAGAACLACLFVALPAFAQTSAALPPVTPTMVVVGFVSLLAGIVSYLVKSGSLFGGRPIPALWVPRLTLAASLLGGMVAAMTAPGWTLSLSGLYYAIVGALSGLVPAALPGVVGHAFFVAPLQHANAIADRATTPPAPPVPLTPAPKAPDAPTPPAAARGFLAGFFAMGACIVAVGCGWFSANSSTLTTYGEQDVQCVFTQLFSGDVSLPGILAACAPLTFTQLVAILDSVLNYFNAPQTADGGVGAPATFCGTGAPPIKGLPTCISADKLAALRSLRDAAQAKVAAGAK